MLEFFARLFGDKKTLRQLELDKQYHHLTGNGANVLTFKDAEKYAQWEAQLNELRREMKGE